MDKAGPYILAGFVGCLIAFTLWYSSITRKPEPLRDKNGILLAENLQEKEEFKTVDGGNHVFGWLFRKTFSDGHYMYLGEERYTGEVVEYYQDKTLHFKGAYTGGEPSGTWIYYYPTGHIARQLKYSVPGAVSSALELFDNGRVHREYGSGESGADTAYFVQYSQQGRLEYLLNNTESPRINYYEPAEDQEMPSFSEIWITNHPPGELVKANTAGEVYMYLHTDSIFYFKDKDSLNLLELQLIKDNKQQGASFLYYRNRQVMVKQEFNKGRPSGDYVCYYANAKVREKGRYTDGRKNGEWQEYFPNGRLRYLRTYSLNELNGKYVEYDEKGKVLEKGNYTDGVRTGNWLLKGNSEEEVEE